MIPLKRTNGSRWSCRINVRFRHTFSPGWWSASPCGACQTRGFYCRVYYWCTSLPITLHLFIIELLSVCIWARHSSNTFDLTSIYWHSKIMKTKAGSYSSYCMKVIPIYYTGEQVLLSVNLLISFHVLNSLLHLQVVWMWFYQKYNQSKSLIWSTISGQHHKDISAQDTEATRLPFCCFRLIQKCVQI